MAITAMRKKLAEYLQTAEDKSVKALYTLVEDKIEAKSLEMDDEFFEELTRRSRSLRNSNAKIYTLEDAKRKQEGG